MSESGLAAAVFSAIYDDTKAALAYLKTSSFADVLSDALTEELVLLELTAATVAIEMQALENVFDRDTAARLRSTTLDTITKVSEDDILANEVLQYEAIWLDEVRLKANPFIRVSERLLYRIKYGDTSSAADAFIVDPLRTTVLASVLAQGIGRWKRLNQHFKPYPD